MQPFIKMIQNVLEHVDDDFLKKKINRYQCWKLIYHPLYWMDYYLSGKRDFKPAIFHVDGLHELDTVSVRHVSKAELTDYSRVVETNLHHFIDRMDPDPQGTKKSDIDVLLGQLRHASFHIGMLYTVILYEKHQMLDTIGPEI
jgi:hypothetical protein